MRKHSQRRDIVPPKKNKWKKKTQNHAAEIVSVHRKSTKTIKLPKKKIHAHCCIVRIGKKWKKILLIINPIRSIWIFHLCLVFMNILASSPFSGDERIKNWSHKKHQTNRAKYNYHIEFPARNKIISFGIDAISLTFCPQMWQPKALYIQERKNWNSYYVVTVFPYFGRRAPPGAEATPHCLMYGESYTRFVFFYLCTQNMGIGNRAYLHKMLLYKTYSDKIGRWWWIDCWKCNALLLEHFAECPMVSPFHQRSVSRP